MYCSCTVSRLDNNELTLVRLMMSWEKYIKKTLRQLFSMHMLDKLQSTGGVGLMSRGGGSFYCFNWSFKAISAEIVSNLPRLPKIGELLLERNRRKLTQGEGVITFYGPCSRVLKWTTKYLILVLIRHFVHAAIYHNFAKKFAKLIEGIPGRNLGVES